MLLDRHLDAVNGDCASEPASADVCEWSVVLPFHNEASLVASAIASLAQQSQRFLLVLVDNGSTDGSAEHAAAACRAHGVTYRLLHEATPGKVAALSRGLRAAATRFVATCDADTFYPPDYLAQAQALLLDGGVMAGAWFVPRSAGRLRRLASGIHLLLSAKLFHQQCLTGGAGQAFRKDSLIAAGGFDGARWNLVLEDHEICHRLARVGPIRYSSAFWCDPEDRTRSRPSTRWSLIERLVYHLTATWSGDWFFYRFLKPRLERRSLSSCALREVRA